MICQVDRIFIVLLVSVIAIQRLILDAVIHVSGRQIMCHFCGQVNASTSEVGPFSIKTA